MRIVRFWNGKSVSYGEWDETGIKELNGSILNGFEKTGRTFSLDGVQLLAPCEPSKIVCVGLNYKDHAEEMNLELPKEPVLFMKPPSSVIGPNATIKYPSMSKRVDFEAELAVVVGEVTRFEDRENALQKVFGYTCANDVTARDLQPADGQWTVAKSFDTFCPVGPYIVTDIDASNLEIALYKNGERMQHSNTKQMIFDIPFLISYLSQIMTLFPGDLILTGTPHGVGPVEVGDKLQVEIEKIGTLTNIVEK
ncbi:MAG: hypothetical protein PWQ96_290 [Clostridia bacterium]|jgi:2-keto-4-pentenoate hydratase/2-oxohepta-3-ene-1,7-dioic acid hydratase in catechol pathway|nr:hypothetical protein [Clostridia bacterium]